MDAGDTKVEDVSAPIATLLENHRAFLRFLERRVGDRMIAEDILQDAFVRTCIKSKSEMVSSKKLLEKVLPEHS